MIDLTGIIAISGQPGLYKVVAQSKNGIIVEGLADKKRTSISSTAKVSSLEDISMFTTGEDKPVSEIMKDPGLVAVMTPAVTLKIPLPLSVP